MLIRVLDFETAGEMPPDCEVIEIGWCDLTDAGISASRSILVQHERPINVETMAVHHLQERDFAGALARAEAFQHLREFGFRDAEEVSAIFCAHSAKFERACWPDAPEPWICTYKCAIRVWPDSPRHSNQVLRYYLGLDLDPALAMPPHRAAPDAYVTAHILQRLLREVSVDDLLKWSSEPALLPRVTFGRNRGTKWTDVDDGFLEWVIVRDFDEDVLFTARTELERRYPPQEPDQAADEIQESEVPF